MVEAVIRNILAYVGQSIISSLLTGLLLAPLGTIMSNPVSKRGLFWEFS